MRWVARGLAGLLLGGLLGGCDALWAPYIGLISPGRLCDPDDQTLVLCLGFEGQAVDGSPNRIAVTGGPLAEYVEGPVGQAARFTASTLPVVLGDSKAWNLSEFTFEAWVRPEQLPTGPLRRFGLMDREGAYSMFLYTNEGQSDLALGCATNDASVQGLRIPLGTFSHVACTFKSGEQVLYLNGKPSDKDRQTVRTPAPGPLQHHLGSNVPSLAKMDPDPLVGSLDELRFFSRGRTAVDIKAAYERGASAPPSRL